MERSRSAIETLGPRNPLYPNRSGVEDIIGAEIADGVEGCVKAVRRQIGAGADWVKVSTVSFAFVYGESKQRTCLGIRR